MAAASAVVALAAVLVALLSGGGSGAARPRTRGALGVVVAKPSTRPRAAVSPTGTTRAKAVPVDDASQGSLPQTNAFPSSETSRFRSRMAAFWSGVVAGSVTKALPAFFPERAYAQLKAIGAPESDWKYRLVHDYALDVGAAHRLLGADPGGAQLLGVRVTNSYGHWVPPGACYNSVGYFEQPNARVVYRDGGAVRSFGIASMISWRGEWYVVHLGAVLREGEGGVVDEAADGVGSSAYSGTC
jgi:hypothetical protein